MTSRTEIYRIEPAPFGRFFIMPRPLASALMQDIEQYQSAGVDTVVSLLEVEEAVQLGLASEESECLAAGLAFLSFPIADYAVPDRRTFLEFVKELIARLHEGQGIAVHCRAGIGRSGMVACSVLGASGIAEPIAEVSRARGAQVPDTAEQRRFIDSVLAELSQARA